jgi:hypothetical protein
MIDNDKELIKSNHHITYWLSLSIQTGIVHTHIVPSSILRDEYDKARRRGPRRGGTPQRAFDLIDSACWLACT